jgi:hypothetical protein
MSSATPNVAAPLWDAAQASPWLTQNLAARIWDAFAFGVFVEEIGRAAPPGTCNDGAKFIVGTGTGLWAGHNGKLAIAIGANASNGWEYATVALEGMLVYNRADQTNYRYQSGAFVGFLDSLSRFQDMLDVTTAGLVDGAVFVWDQSNGQLFPQTIANLLVGYLQATLDTDGTMAANSDLRVASQKAVKTFVNAAVAGLLDLKGGQDCSGNPNYPAASKGDYYFVTVAGRIGGGSGDTVSAADVFFATADNAGGTKAAVGASWDVIRSGASIVAGVSRLQDLHDVDLSGLADGSVLKWDASNGVFYLAQDLGWPFASKAEYRAGQESGKSIAPDQAWAAAAQVALTDAATVAVDLSLGINFTVTLGGNRTLGSPINLKDGQTGCIEIKQDGTGTRTLAYGANWKFAGGTAPVLTTTASARDLLFYQVVGTILYGTLVKDVK